MARQAVDEVSTMSADYFIKSKAGTAIDRRTGLMWLRFALGQEWTGISAKGSASIYTWIDAISYYPYGGYEFAGYYDWRLPTVDELESLLTERGSRSQPTYIDLSIFPNTPASSFWSQTCNVVGVAQTFLSPHCVNFADGKSHRSGVNGNHHVRLVRKEPVTALAGILPGSGSFERTLLTLGKLNPENSSDSTDGDKAPPNENQRLNIEISVATARSMIDTVAELIRIHPAPLSKEIAELRQLLDIQQISPTLEPSEVVEVSVASSETFSLISISSQNLFDILKDLSIHQRVSVSTLRHHLLPLDLMPSAVIEEINERALDLVGELALEEEGGDEIVIAREVLVAVLANWRDSSVSEGIQP